MQTGEQSAACSPWSAHRPEGAPAFDAPVAMARQKSSMRRPDAVGTLARHRSVALRFRSSSVLRADALPCWSATQITQTRATSSAGHW